jgi:hypothetical protein
MFADNALLVSLNISQPTFRKQDKSVNKEVANSHGVKASVGNYNKSLLAGAVELEAVKTATGNVRTFFYKNTLPWALDGAAILPTANYFDFTTEMRRLKSEWTTAVNNFVLNYDALKNQARIELNTLYDDRDYPQAPSKLFKFEITYLPVPQASDFRIQLAAEELTKFEGMIKSTEQEAMKEVWGKLYEVVNKAADRLRDPTGIFRDTLVENAVEVCALLPKLNFSNDANLESMRLEVEQVLASKQPETLRNLPSVRKQTVENLDDIMSRMGTFMGAV